jgi:hypothetical protein
MDQNFLQEALNCHLIAYRQNTFYNVILRNSKLLKHNMSKQKREITIDSKSQKIHNGRGA